MLKSEEKQFDEEMESEEEEEDDDVDDDESGESDKELQIAFEKGLLKPGLFKVEEKKEHVNDVAGLKAALDKFETRRKLEWVERLEVTQSAGDGTEDVSPAVDAKTKDSEELVHDDFRREMAIHRQAQAAWLEALQRLRKLGVPTKRPDDYFAEMVKPDNHMKKVREKILSKQMSMEKTEKLRKLRELKKYGKKVQQEVLAKRQKEKKNLADSVAKFRRGINDKLDFMKDDDFGGVEAEDRRRRTDKADKPTTPKPNKKRIEKNKKFGHGGQKKRGKYNTADSAADLSSGPKPKKGKRAGPPAGKGGWGKTKTAAAGKKAAKAPRLGKSKRMQNKNKRR